MISLRGERERCPYYEAFRGVCLASVSAMAVDGAKGARCCKTEDHDGCAIFLAKILRNSRPIYAGKQIQELALK